MRGPHLPPELTDEIIAWVPHVHNFERYRYYPILLSSCLVCSQWLPNSRRQLFQHVWLTQSSIQKIQHIRVARVVPGFHGSLPIASTHSSAGRLVRTTWTRLNPLPLRVCRAHAQLDITPCRMGWSQDVPVLPSPHFSGPIPVSFYPGTIS